MDIISFGKRFPRRDSGSHTNPASKLQLTDSLSALCEKIKLELRAFGRSLPSANKQESGDYEKMATREFLSLHPPKNPDGVWHVGRRRRRWGGRGRGWRAVGCPRHTACFVFLFTFHEEPAIPPVPFPGFIYGRPTGLIQ